MIVIEVAGTPIDPKSSSADALLGMEDPAESGGLSAETKAKIDKLFDAGQVLGYVTSEKCKAAARKVGCTPSRLYTEFGKRRQAAGTQRVRCVRLPAETKAKIDKLFDAGRVLGHVTSEKCKAAARKVGCTPSRLYTESAHLS